MKPLPGELRIDIWSDIACPWCYVGKRRLETALSKFAHADKVRIVWRAFELDPSAPPERPTDVSYAERLAAKYGATLPRAEGMISRMVEVARSEGLEFRFDTIRPGNTFDAHRVLHLAATKPDPKLQSAVKERFLRGYMTEGAAIGTPETLVRLASEAGLDAEEVRAVLASDAHAGEVRSDEREARATGIEGVPFFVFGGRYAVAGAETDDVLLAALEKAYEENAPALVPIGEGAVCGPEGCN